jgi:uncharacterized protein DUF4391
MTFDRVIASLAIPDDARVDRRVPKKLLIEQGAPTAADKRQIQDGVEEISWVAALKPTNIAVPAFRDDIREYLEIAVVTAAFRASAKPARLLELVHRAIPYPLVLLAAHGETLTFSLAHKRWSQGERGKIVIEDVYRTIPFRPDTPTAQEGSFLTSLAISLLPSDNLFALYQGWIDSVAALEASQITGRFAVPKSTDQASVLRENLNIHTDLQNRLGVLRSQAEKEKQMKRRVELNLEIKRLENQLAAAKASL